MRWLLGRDNGPRTSVTDDALRVLERRFAAGEIDREEFDERRRVLLGDSSGP